MNSCFGWSEAATVAFAPVLGNSGFGFGVHGFLLGYI
jgi:hypothetical protein